MLCQPSTTSEQVIVYRPVRLKESHGCLTCHRNPAQSPWGNGKDILGYQMENWQDGRLHGVFAVSNDIAKIEAAIAQTETFSSTQYLAVLIITSGFISLILASLLIRKPTEALKQSVQT
ncbi:MAG: DUF3365 domain-containing protein [Bdellovibrionia bacterium]